MPAYGPEMISMQNQIHQKKQAALIRVIIEEVKIRGCLTVSEASQMLSLHRQTAEKYFRVAAERGELIRYGRLGLFRDPKAVIDFDLQRFLTVRVSL